MSYRIDPRLPLAAEIGRIASEEARAAIALLAVAAEGGAPDLHATRKRLKKLRGLLRLVRDGDPCFYATENARYRDVAASLSAARDAGALVETADRFLRDFPEAAQPLGRLRAALAERHATAEADADLRAAVRAAVTRLEAGLRALEHLSLPQEPEAAAHVLRAGLERTLRRARRQIAAARRQKSAEPLHELRKSVKHHWMHVGLCRAAWPGSAGKQRTRLKALGERLGELNDIDVLRAALEREDTALVAADDLATVHALLARQEKALRKRCLAGARRLFDEKPAKRAARVARRYRKAARRAAGKPRLAPPVGALRRA
ncbi:CHAD domain-containing protein [Aquibium sp. A9E412]|uniref:CHAD domain-containing protein n=1 Tax=Aquibium sp. A9E412 TaxID=2976767 RepID=UPI0025B26B2B|nr:CHAD domain-containing protein [Aquibium sp. A9E412]MDN2566451.1 CHAD domain-containing protein [Aquibium sp. A9E412]